MSALRIKGKAKARSRLVEQNLTQDELRRRFNYDPETGLLSNRVPRCGGREGAINLSPRYAQVFVGGAYLSAHRVIWCWQTGQWPEWEVDHIDGNSRNNRWSNLRLATPQQNTRWARSPKSATGLRGITKRGKGFCVRIGRGARGNRVYIGTFPTLTEALRARRAAEATYWGVAA